MTVANATLRYAFPSARTSKRLRGVTVLLMGYCDRHWSRVTVRLLTRCLGLEARGEFGIVDEVIEELVPGSGRETRFA